MARRYGGAERREGRLLGAALAVLWLALSPSGRASAGADPGRQDALRLVGQLGGPTQAVAVQGEHAYVGVGQRLTVLDISSPAAPLELGSTTPFPGPVEDLAIYGTLAFVATGDAGLRVVDVSDPTRPREIGAWDSSGYAQGVAISGTLACLADGPYGLQLVDVSVPASPRRLSGAYETHYALDVALHDGVALVAAGGSGLLTVDVQDPARPLELAQYDTPGSTYAVDLAGELALLADGWGGLAILNITNRQEPLRLGKLDTPGWALDIRAAGGYAYLADAAFGLRVIDIHDTARPVELGAWTGSDLARRLALAGSTLLLADSGLGLHVLDVSDAAAITELGRYAPLADARQVAVAGGLATVAAGFQGLRLVDVSQPSSPVELGSFDNNGAFAMGVAIDGNNAFVGTTLQGPHDTIDLRIVDITVPTSPTLVAAWDAPSEFGPFREMVLQNGLLYVADEAGLGIVDVTDPSHPAAVGHLWFDLERQMATVGVAVQGQYAYVAYAAYGLRVVDVSAPANLRIVGAVEPQGGCSGVAAWGDRAYCVSGFEGLTVIDVSQPTLPKIVGRVDTPGYANAVTVAGDLALVSDGGGGLAVIDVSAPSEPRLVARADTPGNAWQATAVDGRVYVADGRGGLSIYDLDALADGAGPEVMAQGTASGGSSVETGEVERLAAARRVDLARLAAAEQAQARLRERYVGLFALAAALPGRFVRAGLKPAPTLATLVVTTTADAGPGTLRAALLAAGPGDLILFDPAVFPPSRPTTITLETPLPPLARGGVTLDASNAGVVLDGRLLPESELGLWLPSDGNAVRGLTLVHFALIAVNVTGSDNTIGGDREIGSGPSGQGNVVGFGGGGIQLGALARGNHVEGNLVGTDPTGSVAWFNWMGVGIGIGPTGNTVGGPTPGRRNLISGNQTGVQILGEGTNSNVVAGNVIGLDLSGSRALPNSWGVRLEWSVAGNTIGGDSPEERNWISGNTEHGVLLSDSGTANNAVIGNWIGTNITGTGVLGNQPGIGVYGCGWNRIGGSMPGEGNVIVSERGHGVDMAGYDASDNQILGNRVGLAADGQTAPGNGVGLNLHVATRRTIIGGAGPGDGNVLAGNSIGLALEDAGTEHNWVLGNQVGAASGATAAWGNHAEGILVRGSAGRAWVQGNVIAGNGTGVRVEASSGITLRRNSISANANQGIHLVDGGNEALAAPVGLSVTSERVVGTACAGCTIEVYSDAEDEGRVYEGTAVADVLGRFELVKPGGLTGPFVTTTATDGEGNTSQFSLPALVVRGRVVLPLVRR